MGVEDFSGQALGSLDTCHHPDAGQILTTIDAPHFPLVGVCKREVGEVKILRWIMNASKLILTLVVEECDESFRFTADILELIIGCTGGYQLSHRATESLKRLCLASLQILVTL